MAEHADCIFCKIVKGTIPSYKLFEVRRPLTILISSALPYLGQASLQ